MNVLLDTMSALGARGSDIVVRLNSFSKVSKLSKVAGLKLKLKLRQED